MSIEDTPRIRLSALPRATGHPVRWEPSAEVCGSLAAELEIRALRKLRFEGRLSPEGRADWRLDGALGATAVQDCVVTLEPVTTRVDVEVERLFAADAGPGPAGETEMAEDADLVEPLPETLDLRALLAEALLLELPRFPRADGAELGLSTAAPPGARPLEEEREKPFAGLAELRARLEGEE